MHYTLDDVTHWLNKVLGYDEVEGLFIDDGVISDYVEPQSYEIFTNMSTLTEIEKEIAGANIFMGATKLVISPHKRPYVIKIPFTGVYHCDRGHYGTDDTGCYRWIKNENPTYKFISHTLYDVCNEEIMLYEERTALTKTVIANNELVLFYGKLPIYIQEKTKETSGWLDDKEVFPLYSKAKVEIARRIRTRHTRYCVGFVLRLLDFYGINNTKTILEEIDNNIYDLHDENYGYRRNGSPVFFDIGGYDRTQWGI